MRKAAFAIALASILAVAVPWAVTAQTPPEDAALDRVERKYGAYDFGCIDNFCDGPTFQVQTPLDVTAVDIVVTVTLSYRLAAGHNGSAVLGRSPMSRSRHRTRSRFGAVPGRSPRPADVRRQPPSPGPYGTFQQKERRTSSSSISPEGRRLEPG